MAFCGIECIDLKDGVIKILGIYLSCNAKLEQEKNFLNHIVKISKYMWVICRNIYDFWWEASHQ